jgi:hypothetical protein
MSGVLAKFAIASAVMWTAPVAIVYGFYYQMIPGLTIVSNLHCFSSLLLKLGHMIFIRRLHLLPDQV